MKWDSVFTGNYNGRNLSDVLAEWANDNEIHDSGGDVCHCDFCQIFVPMAHQMERDREAIQDAFHRMKIHAMKNENRISMENRGYGDLYKLLDERNNL